MRILFLGQYFPPEITAGATRLHAFATGLSDRGHEVEVISEIPSHPAGVVAAGYGGRMVDRREMDGFHVNYVWVRATPSKAARARLLNYASYALTASIAGARIPKPDVILASSPPLTVGSAGALVARRHRVPWALDVRDLWPDAAVALGQVGEGAALKAAKRLELGLYRGAAAITVTTEPVAATLASRGGEGKVSVIPNGAAAAFLEAGAEEPDSSALPGSGEAFRWMYAGNVGLVAGLEVALDAAEQLGDGFELTILGDGQKLEELRRRAAGLPEAAVGFMPAVPPERAAEMMRASDALLVPRAPNPALDEMVLSKLYDCCAVGRPVVVSAAGETARLAGEAEAALCVPPGDAAALAEAIRRLRDDQGLGERLAGAGRRFAELNSRERGVDRLVGVLEGALEPRAGR